LLGPFYKNKIYDMLRDNELDLKSTKNVLHKRLLNLRNLTLGSDLKDTPQLLIMGETSPLKLKEEDENSQDRRN
jgi:hypothetical protein